MTTRPHRPVRLPSSAFDVYTGAPDPAETSRAAHETAAALLHRARGTSDPQVVSRLVRYADEYGIDDLAELWSAASAVSLPGALWRLYLIRQLTTKDAETTAYCFRRGVEVDRSISRVVAGAVTPTGPVEIVQLCDTILRGAFTGDAGVALERAAAFCRIMSQGAVALAESSDSTGEQESDAWIRRAARYLELAGDLHAAALRWSDDLLD